MSEILPVSGSDQLTLKATGNGAQTVAEDVPNSSQEMTKRQRRKLEKVRQWEENKKLRKEKRKQRKQEMKERKRQRLETMKLKALEKGEDPSAMIDRTSRKQLKSNSMQKSLCKVGVCIDMSFNDLMIEKDLQKCIKQVSRCYGINRRYENPVQFFITSLNGKALETMDKKNDGWRNWDVYFRECIYLELEKYAKENIVYLTAESDNVLTELDDSNLYVIGGLVDHNSKKGLCHQLAIKNGVQHARLPLDQFVDMKVRKVLTIVHVFEILGNVAQKRPWQEVIMEALPQRTNAKLKRKNNSEGDSSSSADEDESIVKEENISNECCDTNIISSSTKECNDNDLQN